MQARTIPVLTIALSAALLSPLAMAQDQSTGAMGQASTTGQAMPPTSGTMSNGTMSTDANGSAPSFTTLDANGDGRISAAEARSNSSVSGGFASMDADRDGYVSNAEFTAHGNAGSTMGNADWSDSDSSSGSHDKASMSSDKKDTSDTTPPPTP